MKEIKHLNIINLKDVFFDEESFCTLMDYMVYDLKNLIANHFDYITIKDIKCILHQIITGLNFLHKSWIFHRDVSPANMFLNNEGVLKISDLGFAKYFGSPDRLLTKGAVTLLKKIKKNNIIIYIFFLDFIDRQNFYLDQIIMVLKLICGLLVV